MIAYAFETITAQQALAIRPQDVVSFEGGPDRALSLTYNIPVVGPPTVTIAFGDRAVEFGLQVLEISERGGLHFTGGGSVRRNGTGATELNTTAA